MSTKKPFPKTSEPKAKYAIGQRLFTIVYHKGKPEEIVECKVVGRSKREYQSIDGSGKKRGTIVIFSYEVVADYMIDNRQAEESLYPSFQSAANKFAQSFTHLLK